MINITVTIKNVSEILLEISLFKVATPELQLAWKLFDNCGSSILTRILSAVVGTEFTPAGATTLRLPFLHISDRVDTWIFFRN